ncbi:MAG TPA: NB-ARC domain-containing protein, partial [Burkholderiaceae bacterium]|nr:NB-ARC domain-containing protein [Burkholderiaceae bacterium]
EKAGLEVARMEGYTAADERPVDKCLHDVAASDLYVGIYAWRYGYEPPAHHANPLGKSITELEYREAERRKLRRLVFLAHPDTKAQWPPHFVDEVTGSASGGKKLNAFRAEIGTELTASMFRTPDELATLVLAAIMRTGLTGRPYNVPPQRPGVVPRPALIEAVRQELVESGGAGRNTLVWGPGGFGKTTLALLACHAPEVVKAFPDGMLWVALGEHADLPTVLSDLHVTIAGERPAASGTSAIAETVAKALAGRRCLLVIDDVWRSDDLAPFLTFDGPRLLVTSRIQNLLAETIATDWGAIPVDQMEAEEAAALLGRGLSLDARSRVAITDLADKLGCWPLLLGLANARLLEEHKSRRNIAECIERVATVYKAKGVLGFDRRDSNARNAAVVNSVEVGLTHAESMSAGLARRAAELAIFPEDVAVSVRVLADLWGVDELHAEEDAVRPLDNVCLVQWDRERGEVSLHDMIRRALAAKLADAPAVHGRLVDAWGDSHHLPHDYAWRRLAYHLEHGQRHAQLSTLLRDFAWLRAKLQATDIVALVADFEALPADDPLWLIQGALRLASSYLAADKAQLASQLVGRLKPGVHADIDALLAQTNAWRGEPWLRPLQPTLHGAGGPLVRVFRGYAGGHRGTVRSIAMDAAGRWAVSAGNSTPDQCIIVWNLATGTHYKLEGQAEAGGWTPLAMTGKGDRFVSAHSGEVRAWRVAEMAPFATCRVPGARVGVVDIDDSGMRVIIGGPDGEIALWNPAAGSASALGRHEPAVDDVAITPDGLWAVSINAVDARLWDLGAGREAQRWPTPDFSRPQWVRGVAIADEGRRVAWTSGAPGSAEGGIWQWNGSTGTSPLVAGPPVAGGICTYRFERGRAIVLHPHPRGRPEMTFALLVFSDKPRVVELTDIGRGIVCAAVSRDGRWAITADYEHDLMLWDLD